MKRMLFLIVLCFALFMLPVCGIKDKKSPEESQDKRIILGFSQLGDESDWRTANTESINVAAKEANIELKFSNAQQKQENQVDAIRSFIAQGIDVIAFSPVVETGWDSVLKEANSAGIPVIITDRAIETNDESLYTTYIGSDFLEEGRKAGKWLEGEMKNIKGEIDIAELLGTPGSAPMLEREQGFREIIAGHPNMKVILSQSGDFMRSKGKEVMESFLKTDKNRIKVLYAHNDDMALGAVEAIEEAGLKPGKDITVISVDAGKGAFKAMMAGKLNCSIECNPLLGPQLMKAVKDIVGHTPVPKRIITREWIFDQGNAEIEFTNRKY